MVALPPVVFQRGFLFGVVCIHIPRERPRVAFSHSQRIHNAGRSVWCDDGAAGRQQAPANEDGECHSRSWQAQTRQRLSKGGAPMN